MNRKVNNIKELAEQLQLSPTTVSRVLNGKSEIYRISKSTSAKVVAAAQKFQYNPNLIARGLKLEKTETIGLIIPDIANPYFGSIAKTIEVEAYKHGYSIILCDSLDNLDAETGMLHLLTGRKVDGIIIAPTGQNNIHVAELQQQGIPVVVIDRYLPDASLSFISTDNFSGAVMAVSHFIENGHRQIACIQGVQGISVNTDRVRGYRDALQQAGVEPRKEWILGDDFGEENGYDKTMMVMAKKNRPTAIFALSNLISLGVLRAVKELGLTVPDDVSVISFDEQPYSAYLACPMTTVEQPREEMGRRAIDLLLRKFQSTESKKTESISLAPRLIKRESVKNINQKL